MAHLWPKQATWGNNVCSSNGVSMCQMLILSLYSPASQRLHQDVWAGGFWAVLHGSVVWVWDLTVWEFWTQTVDDTRNLQLRWWKKKRACKRLLTMTDTPLMLHQLKQTCAQRLNYKPQHFTVQTCLSALQSGKILTMYTYWRFLLWSYTVQWRIRVTKIKRRENLSI